jgi:hypothetical protein
MSQVYNVKASTLSAEQKKYGNLYQIKVAQNGDVTFDFRLICENAHATGAERSSADHYYETEEFSYGYSTDAAAYCFLRYLRANGIDLPAITTGMAQFGKTYTLWDKYIPTGGSYSITLDPMTVQQLGGLNELLEKLAVDSGTKDLVLTSDQKDNLQAQLAEGYSEARDPLTGVARAISAYDLQGPKNQDGSPRNYLVAALRIIKKMQASDERGYVTMDQILENPQFKQDYPVTYAMPLGFALMDPSFYYSHLILSLNGQAFRLSPDMITALEMYDMSLQRSNQQHNVSA